MSQKNPNEKSFVKNTSEFHPAMKELTLRRHPPHTVIPLGLRANEDPKKLLDTMTQGQLRERCHAVGISNWDKMGKRQMKKVLGDHLDEMKDRIKAQWKFAT